MDTGTAAFHPFRKPCLNSLSLLLYEINLVTRDLRSRRIFGLLAMNVVSSLILMAWSVSSNSLCLAVCSTILLIDFLSLLTCLLGFWVEQKKPNKIFTFGHIRIEILVVFVITIVSLITALLSLRDGFTRISSPPDVHLVHLIPGILLCIISHLVVKIMNDKGKAFGHVFTFAPSNFIQDYLAKLSRSSLLLPRLNPLTIFLSCGVLSIVLVSILEEFCDPTFCDTAFGILMSFILVICILPLTSFTGNILLQTTPTHMIGHLDKCLREASTMDGVLEFRNEHFWTLGYNNLVGSLHVRVRREANEQIVLSHLTNRLSNLVSDLTIQVFKDEWSWQNNPRSLLQHHKSDGHQANFLKYNSLSTSSSTSSLLSQSNPTTSSSVIINNIISPSISTPPFSVPSSSSTSIPISNGERNSQKSSTDEWIQNV